MRKEDISNQTRAQLASATAKLIKKKPIDKISIREITDACDYPRSTFYYHYDDIYDLAAWIMAEHTVEAMRVNGKPATLWGESVVGLFKHFHNHIDFVRNIFSSKEFLRMADLFCLRAVDKILPDIIAIDGDRHTDPEFLHLLTMFYGHSMIDVCSKWVRNGMTLPPEEMAAILDLIVKDSFLSTLDRAQDARNAVSGGALHRFTSVEN